MVSPNIHGYLQCRGRNVFLIKSLTNYLTGNIQSGAVNIHRIVFPKDLIGKRVKIKIFFMEDENGDDEK